MEFPVIIPDCDSDGVNEMALVQYINNMPTLTIVSGKSGLQVIKKIINDNCTKMTDLFLNSDMSLVYTCRKNSGAGVCIIAQNRFKLFCLLIIFYYIFRTIENCSNQNNVKLFRKLDTQFCSTNKT